MDINDVERALEECGADMELIKQLNDLHEWADLFVKEMLSATDLDDAKNRAARALKPLEESIRTRVSSQLLQENADLKEQIGVLIHQNLILKRAVSIQHEREKDKAREIEHYISRIKTLEIDNYALSMHLKQAA
ncbi:hypothetical protein V2J09_012637 [Rumex salicifolius]